MTRILGAILSGGASSRFGGDKLMADVAGMPLIEHVTAQLSPQVAMVVLLGRGYGGLAYLPDRPAPNLGPLGGLNSAVHFAIEHEFDAVLMVPGDTVNLPMDLTDALGEGPAYVSDSPVTGIWPASLAPKLELWLAEGRTRSVAAFGDHIDARAVTLDKPVVNINTRRDYEIYLADEL